MPTPDMLLMGVIIACTLVIVGAVILFISFNLKKPSDSVTPHYFIHPQLLRWGWLALLVIPSLWDDWPALKVLLYVIGVTTMLGIVSHIIRFIVFPMISMEDAWNAANDTPAGAAICFLGICIFLSTILFVSGSLLR